MGFLRQGSKLYATIFIIALLCSLARSQQCHYSCANCTTPASYITCFSCADPADTLTVLEDTKVTNPLYWHSLYESGICTAKVPQGSNGLGIFLLVISIIGLLITQSHQAFYICSTFQTFALFGLLQVPWLEPASLILQAFQYFMPINIMLAPSKIKDHLLFIYRFYRLDKYMVSTQNTGLLTIFIIDCVLFLIIVTLFVLTIYRRRKLAQQLEEQKKQIHQQGNVLVPQFSNTSQNDIEELKKQKDMKSSFTRANKKAMLETESQAIATDNVKPITCKEKLRKLICDKASQCLSLRNILHILMYVFYFLVQETCLSIMVGAVFSISSLDVVIWVIYFIEIITVLVISIYETQVDKDLNPKAKNTHEFGLSLFLSRECLFVVLLKKIILPLGVVIPINVQYIYFILYMILFLVEGSLDARSGRVICLSRMTLWKVFEMCVTTLILTFFLNERNSSTEKTSHLINIILTITLIVFVVIFFVELAFSLFSMFLGVGKVQNTFEENSIKNQKKLQLNITQMALNELQKNQSNIFEDIQMTRENTKTPKNVQQSNQSKKIYKMETVKVEEFNQDEQDDFPQPPKINNQLVINKTKDNSKIKPSPDKIQSKDKKKDEEQKIDKQVQNDEQAEGDEKKAKRRRVIDPQLRKRYGIK